MVYFLSNLDLLSKLLMTSFSSETSKLWYTIMKKISPKTTIKEATSIPDFIIGVKRRAMDNWVMKTPNAMYFLTASASFPFDSNSY